jgi:hypothetical protein
MARVVAELAQGEASSTFFPIHSVLSSDAKARKKGKRHCKVTSRMREGKRAERPPSKAEQEIQKIAGSAEQRCIALGSRYSELTLTEEQLNQVEDDLRKARMYEILLLSESLRRGEMDELKRKLIESEKAEETKRQRNIVQSQLMRQKALKILQAEADAVKREEEKRLADDRRLLLQREKEKVLDRRRRFEAEMSEIGGGGLPDGRPTTPGRSASTSADRTAPVLVMNVALGNGKEDRLVVRRYDDPKRLAQLFAKKHHLPDNAISTLSQQIKANLHAAQQREAQAQSRLHQLSASQRRNDLEPNPNLSNTISPFAATGDYGNGTSAGRRGTPTSTAGYR